MYFETLLNGDQSQPLMSSSPNIFNSTVAVITGIIIMPTEFLEQVSILKKRSWIHEPLAKVK